MFFLILTFELLGHSLDDKGVEANPEGDGRGRADMDMVFHHCRICLSGPLSRQFLVVAAEAGANFRIVRASPAVLPIKCNPS